MLQRARETILSVLLSLSFSLFGMVLCRSDVALDTLKKFSPFFLLFKLVVKYVIRAGFPCVINKKIASFSLLARDRRMRRFSPAGSDFLRL